MRDQNGITFWCFSTIWEKILISWTLPPPPNIQRALKNKTQIVSVSVNLGMCYSMQDNPRCHHFHLLGHEYIRELIRLPVFQTKKLCILVIQSGKHLFDAHPSSTTHASPTNPVTGLIGIHDTLMTMKSDVISWCINLSGVFCNILLLYNWSKRLLFKFLSV